MTVNSYSKFPVSPFTMATLIFPVIFFSHRKPVYPKTDSSCRHICCCYQRCPDGFVEKAMITFRFSFLRLEPKPLKKLHVYPCIKKALRLCLQAFIHRKWQVPCFFRSLNLPFLTYKRFLWGHTCLKVCFVFGDIEKTKMWCPLYLRSSSYTIHFNYLLTSTFS